MWEFPDTDLKSDLQPRTLNPLLDWNESKFKISATHHLSQHKT